MRHWYRVAGARLTGRADPLVPHAHQAEQVWLSVCSQIAKSTWLYAVAAFALRNCPRRMGFVVNRIKDLHTVRKTRLERMVESMPPLSRLLPAGIEARERALSQSVWTVGASLLFWLCGSVADDCRAHDLPLLLCDEIDTYPDDVDGQGDPIDLLLVRQRTFARQRLILGASSPGRISGHAWRRLCTGSHHRPLILCPSCGGADWLNHRQISLAGDRKLAEVHPEEILGQRLGRWLCRHCGELHQAAAVRAAINECIQADRWCPGSWSITADHPTGHWVPHADLDSAGRLRGIAPYAGRIWSGQAGALYSPDETLDTVAARMAIAAQGKVTQQITITNTDHAEPWISVVPDDSADTDAIARRAQDGGGYLLGSLPEDAPQVRLLLLIDQQGNQRDQWWFPWLLRAVARGGDSWLVDAGKAASQAELADLERRRWLIAGHAREPDLLAIDIANGHFQFDGYLWAAIDPHRRCVFRGQGRLPSGTPWREEVEMPRRRRTPRPAGVREFSIAPHFWRDRLWDRMRRRHGEPRWHLPADAPAFYLKSLTAEEQVVERRRIPGEGFRDVVVWQPRLVADTSDRQTFRTDNHWWDLEAAACALADAYGLCAPIAAETQAPDAVSFVHQLTSRP
jgi:phage terminase large subunit GpA-like protein